MMSIDLLYQFLWRWLLLFFLLSIALLLIYQALAWLRNSKGQSNRKALLQLFSIEASLESSALHSSFKHLQTSPWLNGKFKSLAWLCPQWAPQVTSTPSFKDLQLCLKNYLTKSNSTNANWPPLVMTMRHHSIVSSAEEVSHDVDDTMTKQWQVTRRGHLLWLSVMLVVLFNIDAIKISKNLWQQTTACISQNHCSSEETTFSETTKAIGIGWPKQSVSYYLKAVLWPEPLQKATSWLSDKQSDTQSDQVTLTTAPPSQHLGWLIAAILIWLLALAPIKLASYLHSKSLKNN
ncbi:MAG TPA: hypothetical protein VIM85_07800 [Pseudomonadales bacterium]